MNSNTCVQIAEPISQIIPIFTVNPLNVPITRMKQLGKLIIVSIFIVNGACQTTRKNQCIPLTPQYKVLASTVTYNYDGETKTVTEYDTLRPLGKIYGCGKEYFYHAKYFDAEKHLLSNSQLTITGTNNWVNFDASQTEIRYDFPYSMQDSLLFSNKLKSYQIWEMNKVTGIIETKEKVWLHPVRSNQFVETEIMAFPEIYLPAEIGAKWAPTLSVYDGWGKWANTKNESFYEITSKTSKKINNRDFDCWVVEANTKHYNHGSTDSSYTRLLFNETLGFVEICHKLNNQDSIVFEMYDFKIR